MSNFSDEQVMLDVASGNVHAMGMLFERHHRELFSFFVRWTGRQQIAEDLVQDVFFRMLKYRQSYSADMPWKAWMFRIAHRVGLDFFNAHKGEQAMAENFDCSDKGRGVQGLETREDLVRLEQGLAQLSDQNRELILAAKLSNLKQKDIAKALNISVSALKVRLHRALNELRDLVSPQTKEV